MASILGGWRAEASHVVGPCHVPWIRRALVAALLGIAGLFAYRPALNRYFVGDQLWYFAELKGDRSFPAGLRLLDYSVTRTYMKGDELLYRPLLFLLLDVENAVFGRDYRAYNALNLVLHLLVAYLLFELLSGLNPSAFSALFALLFCVLNAGMELVVWNHLGGYLLCDALLLSAMIAALKAGGAAHGRPRRVWLGAYAAAMTAAMLCHEISVLAAFLLGALVVRDARRAGAGGRAAAVAAASPIAVFGALYAFHLLRCERLFWGLSPAHLDIGRLSMSVARTLLVWTQRTLNPAMSRYVLVPYDRFHYAPVPAAASGGLALAVAASGAAAFCLRRGLTRAHLRRAAPLAAAASALMVGYAGLNSLGRSYAAEVSYYLYFFSLMGTVLAYSLVDFSKPSRPAKLCAAALLGGFVLVNLRDVRAVSLRLRDVYVPFDARIDDLASQVDAFVRAHDDPRLAFSVRVHPRELTPPFPYWNGYMEGPPAGFLTLPELLYLKYRAPGRPGYALNFEYPPLQPP